jgi:cytochrome b involved in lipid metabolism
VRSDLPEYSYEEVYQHNTPESYWVVIDSHVYDVSKYAARHPGGGIEETFARGHGTDVGRDFQELHSFREKRITASLLIGRIKKGSVSDRVAKPRPIPVLELEDEPLTEWVETPLPTHPVQPVASTSETPVDTAAATSATAFVRRPMVMVPDATANSTRKFSTIARTFPPPASAATPEALRWLLLFGLFAGFAWQVDLSAVVRRVKASSAGAANESEQKIIVDCRECSQSVKR